VNNRRLCDAVVASLETRGVPFRLGRPAYGLLRQGPAVSGVRLAGGDVVEAGAVCLSAGAWSGGLAGLPRPLPVEPRRGQMLALRAPVGVFRHNVFSASTYLVPRMDGSVFVGATVERVGFDKRVTADGVASLLAGARRIAPALGSAELLETWAGLRPGTPDDLPILGADPEAPNLFYATGHFRNGVLLAPVTAQIALDGLTGTPISVPLDPFRPDRFAVSLGPARSAS
jgi:glycine oxidase